MLHPQVTGEMYQNFHLYNVKKVLFFSNFFRPKNGPKNEKFENLFSTKNYRQIKSLVTILLENTYKHEYIRLNGAVTSEFT